MNEAHGSGSTTWHAVWEVARKEVLQHVRTKRLLIIGGLILFALVMITLVFGPRIARNLDDFGFFDDSPAAAENMVLVVFLGFLGLVFIQLLPIVLTADAVCSEWSSRTIFLLLSKPVSRSAFVLGKFLGSIVTVLGTLVILLGLDYLLMQPLYPGNPDMDDILGFAKFVAFLCVGCSALAAMALFFSTITRSTSISILVTLGVWLVGFTLLQFTGDLINAGRDNPDEDLAQFFRYLNPGYDMSLGIGYLTGDDVSDGSSGGGFGAESPKAGFALLALAIHIVVWFSAALLVVQRRNFE